MSAPIGVSQKKHWV